MTDETEEVTLTIETSLTRIIPTTRVSGFEIWQDGHWCVIPDKQDFVTMQLFTLPGNATDEVTFSFVNHYDKLGDGRYRIVMNFSSMDGSTAIAAAEFGIGRAEKVKADRLKCRPAGRHYLFLRLCVALEPVHEAVDGGGVYVTGDDFLFS